MSKTNKVSLRLLSWVLVLSVIVFPIARFALSTWQFPNPEAILTLGGGSDRELFTAKFALEHPELNVWVSSGISDTDARSIFESVGIADDRIHLDYRAIDTVTNFTTIVNDLTDREIKHIYLITSEFHMPRARAIATIVLGSKGITFTPISVASNQKTESLLHILRDIGRSYLWLVTNRTGSSLVNIFKPDRAHASNQSPSLV